MSLSVPPDRRHRRGLTLAELMIVTSLLGVIAAFSTRQVFTYVQERSVIAAAETLHGDVQQAFMIAARNRRPVRIAYASTDTAIRVTSRDGAITYIRRGLGAGAGFGLRPSDITFCSSSCGTPTVDVFPNGFASDTLFVRVARGTFNRAFHMSRTGMVIPR